MINLRSFVMFDSEKFLSQTIMIGIFRAVFSPDKKPIQTVSFRVLEEVVFSHDSVRFLILLRFRNVTDQ